MFQVPKGFIAQSTPAVWKQYNKMAVSHFSSKFPSNIYSLLYLYNPNLGIHPQNFGFH